MTGTQWIRTCVGSVKGCGAGFTMASDIVEIAFDKAWVGELLMTDREHMELLGKAVDATNAELAAEVKHRC